MVVKDGTTYKLKAGEVAEYLGIDPKTLLKWVAKGKLSYIRSPGGHRRYNEAEVRAFFTKAQD